MKETAEKTAPTGSTIARTLSDAILAHRLVPGAKLGEDEIGEIFGVSRTVVRTALQALAHDDLVQLARHRGAFVAQPSLREAQEVFEARQLIEPATARAAASRISAQGRVTLERHVAEEHGALEAADHGRAVRLSGMFHTEIARIADQQTILRMVETLVARSSLVVALYWRRESALCGSTAHHALVDALVAGDGAGAETLMRAHLGEVLAALDLRERPDSAAQPARGFGTMIHPATLDELGSVLDWAAREGWNPGLDDAEAFHRADPEGFLIKTVADEPVAAISVVNHAPDCAFLGLYICRPEFRGQGHGLDVWRAGLDHAGGRTVGLDGVPAQQDNYARSGFVRTGRTVRYRGSMAPGPYGAVREARPDDIHRLVEREVRHAGVRRDRFLDAWFRPTPTRRTLIDPAGDTYATIRRCREGWKVGPLAAPTPQAGLALIGALVPDAAPVSVDVPDTSASLAAALAAAGFYPVFETARMYLGRPPVPQPPPCYAIATLELG